MLRLIQAVTHAPMASDRYESYSSIPKPFSVRIEEIGASVSISRESRRGATLVCWLVHGHNERQIRPSSCVAD